MIRYTMNLSDEKKRAAVEIALDSEGNTRKRKRIIPIILIAGIIEIISGVFFYSKNVSTSGVILIVIGILMILLAFKAKSFQRFALQKAERLFDSSFRKGIVEYILDVDGIQIVSQTGKALNYWSAFEKYGVMGQYIYIQRKDHKMILIDRNDLSKEEIKEFRQRYSRFGNMCIS